MIRRDFLWSGAAAVALLAGTAAALRIGRPQGAHATETFEVTKTEAEWRAVLSDAAFNVLRKEGTEYPGTSPLLNEHRKGIFACAGCDLPLYSSETKFDSGTGWPSFWQEIPNAVGMTVDRSLGMTRTEVHCRRCGGHLGHVFDDGPPPTGLRHCINGVALTFKPATA
ncbi:MAG: peptide-methionine (R)-S-oxide reductase MsrB [Mesorhizobium sp.]|uniref:peptide-methionine (R)-S-oxide reductase MsrB n=1 Tax=Mesorhizobium sp. TaxID=1871066 RepID=UPI001215618A|nr:peptide-methionine (R)-S-oxide reductase MsrB [Mesorhizobium sp.]TIL75569.1 MAG: peptide-methionine (R)-S-oxide reductase MsrB [Mesorhizobium sp.]TIL89501.1 MAG: peptide-methionine (R)-S-oxide reductase MsrB [Mesorhizobium sp.]TIM00549.1 MAG: peptide-methionine (R)-S-oxide reductase MsrB [Mesorhizobium sp.]